MSTKQVKYKTEARDALKRGVDILADAVKVTLGPKGRVVVIAKNNNAPVITKDGVTVAKEIDLSDPMENIGAQLVKQVASMTADIAGDGTTTATVLAQAIVTAGLKNVTGGANPMDLKRGIEKAVAEVVKYIKENSIVVGDDNTKIKHIASVSSNNDEAIGSLIADAMAEVGNDGIISIEEATGTETKKTVTEGMQFGQGYLSPMFITNTKKKLAEFENPHILIYDKKISSMSSILPILEQQLKTKRPFIILCDELDGEAGASLVVNKMRGNLNICAVKVPGYGPVRKEILEDIAIFTGGLYVSEDFAHKLEDVEVDDLGTADKVVISGNNTVMIGGGGDKAKIKARIEDIRANIAAATTDYEASVLKERLARLSGGVAVLHIGGATEVEMREKKDRVDDALHATRAAIEEGIVPGGGVIYIRAISALSALKGGNDDETTGIGIIRRALEEPLRQIIENAGLTDSDILSRVKKGEGDFGYNARTDTFESLIAGGVIDPAKVVRIALENAASIAALLLTTECVLYEDKAPVTDHPFSNIV